MRRHYPGKRELATVLKERGPHAAAAAEAGGTEIHFEMPPLVMPGRGCGSPVPVLRAPGLVGTPGVVQCGRKFEGVEILCALCNESLRNDDNQYPTRI